MAWISIHCLTLAVYAAAAVMYLAFFKRSFGPLIRGIDLAAAIVGGLASVLWLGVFVLLLMWVYRASKNLRFATDQPLENSPGMSVGWFFVPIANYFMPRRVLKEIWYASHLGRPNGHAPVNRVWGLWIGAAIYALPISLFIMNASTARTRGLALVSYVVYYALEIALGFAILFFATACTVAYEANVDETILEAVDRGVNSPSGWHADPAGRHQLRFWSGREWTKWVSDDDVQSEDPLG